MNDHQFCFIICYNNDLFIKECILYINNLIIPDGYTIDILTITDASSMTSGYNEAMKNSSAQFKIYMHQDVFILNKYFLINILNIFKVNKKIGMIGMVGSARINKEAIMWGSERVGRLLSRTNINNPYYPEMFDSKTESLKSVSAIDGFMMVTCHDIPWREDIFDGWDFYDLSQCMEFMRRGYSIVVPDQSSPWCLHDDRVALSLFDYNFYRKIFLKEYAQEINNMK